jgi:hypothetical protein
MLRVGFIALLVGTAIREARAQTPENETPSVLSAAESIPHGRMVRASYRDGSEVTGPFGGVVDGVLLIGRSPVRVQPGDVDSLMVGRGSARRGAKAGAIAGGIGGAVIFGALLATIVHNTCETDDCETAEAAVVGGLLGGAVGAAGGALIGAAVGSQLSSWTMVYPVPRSTQKP